MTTKKATQTKEELAAERKIEEAIICATLYYRPLPNPKLWTRSQDEVKRRRAK